MKIGLDLDGVLYSHPGFFIEFIASMSKQGHKFFCISSHGINEWGSEDVPRLRAMGYNPDLIDPSLMNIVRHGDLSIKGWACDQCDVVFDDDDRLGRYTKAMVICPLPLFSSRS
jgi:hypothetical protein